MPFVEKKRIAKDDEAGTRLVRLVDSPGGLGWSDLWWLTEVREFDRDEKKDGCWIVQIAYILRDQHGRVGVYQRAPRVQSGARFSRGPSVLAGSSLLSWGMLDHHDATFAAEYPALNTRIRPGAIEGGIRYRGLGVGYSIVKRRRGNAERTRRYVFVIYEAGVRVRDDAGVAAEGVTAEGVAAEGMTAEGVTAEPLAPDAAADEADGDGGLDTFLGLVPVEEAVRMLAAAPEPPAMDLAVLDALAETTKVHERGLAAKRETTCFRLREPRGSTKPLVVRLKAWSDRHPWLMLAIWAGSLALASIADLRGALGR